MYRSMIVLGHQPPHIVQEAGPHVVCTLIGGTPNPGIFSMVQALRPTERQADARIAVIVYALLHRPFLTDTDAAAILQSDTFTARTALRAAAQTTLESHPLVVLYKDVWRFGPTAWKAALAARDLTAVEPMMSYASVAPESLQQTANAWLATHESITTGDVVELTGVSRGTAQKALADLVELGLDQVGAGRTTRFRRSGGGAGVGQ